MTILFDPPLRKDEFIALFGELYESSPWVAEAVWPDIESGQIATADALLCGMKEIVDQSTDAQILRLLRAHPELVGKAAIAGDMTNASKREQSSAGLDQCSPEEFDAFQRLNSEYNERFGFPFIIAVTGLTRADILAAFQMRVGAATSDERKEALEQVHKIAKIRFDQIDRGVFGEQDG